jgi:hypothetical protein
MMTRHHERFCGFAEVWHARASAMAKKAQRGKKIIFKN